MAYSMSDVQMDRTLSSEQKRIDFRPPEDLPPPLDKPTDACLFATALLTAAAKSAQQALQGSNSSAFTSEVSQLHNLPPCWWHICSLCKAIVCVTAVLQNVEHVLHGKRGLPMTKKKQKVNTESDRVRQSRKVLSAGTAIVPDLAWPGNIMSPQNPFMCSCYCVGHD